MVGSKVLGLKVGVPDPAVVSLKKKHCSMLSLSSLVYK